MSYIVVIPGPDGEEVVTLCATLDAATARAEDLRNRHGVADVRLGRVEPIAFTFAPQYRVNIAVDRTPAPARQATEASAGTATIEAPARVQPGELSTAEIDEMVAIDEGNELSTDDAVVREALARRDQASQRQNGLFGR